MRILWLCHFVPYPATGHGALQRTHQLLVHAADRHEVGLVALAPTASTSESLQDAQVALGPRLSFCDLLPLGRGRRLRQLRAGLASALTERTYWEWLFDDRHARAALKHRIREFQPDVIHLDSALLYGYSQLLSGHRLAVTHHNIESDLYQQRGEVAGGPIGLWLRREARKLTRRESTLATAAAINLVVSEPDAARLRDLVPGARTVTVPNGVDVEFFQPDPAIPVRPRSLVFVGGMDWYPNRLAMEWFVKDIWPVLRSGDPERTMTVVGRSAPPALIRESQQDTQLVVTGFLDDVRPTINSAFAYICPIQVGGGTRLKILDALSMSRPLVSTALGVSGLGLVDGKHYLAAETPDDFARQIALLENDTALATALGRNGREYVKRRFSWSTIADALDAAFSEALPRRA
jgi:glycosyltransferase involved in cell wall biosynthesis